jgi:Ca2+-binding EF-hand superfamily protein
MKKLDLNRDGRISEEELLKILSGQTGDVIPPALLPQVINDTLKKIATGADDYNDMRGYAKSLIKKFDRNQDGQIQFKELCDGLKTMNIYLTSREKEALMKKLDINSDGSISDEELYQALSSINIDQLKQLAKESAEFALKKIAGGADDFPNMREYVRFLMRKFDANGDGFISYEELTAGMKAIHINLTLREKLALMKKLDLNKDG